MTLAQRSFEEVQTYWMQELKHQCFGEGGLQLCLVGNKSDLTDRRVSTFASVPSGSVLTSNIPLLHLQQVSEEEGRDLADEYGSRKLFILLHDSFSIFLINRLFLVVFFETSAKSDLYVSDVFTTLGTVVALFFL